MLGASVEEIGVLNQFVDKQALSKRPSPDLKMIRLLLELDASLRLGFNGIFGIYQLDGQVRASIDSAAGSWVARKRRLSRKVDGLLQVKRKP